MPLLDIVLGYDCNLACTYCTITPAMRQRALPADRIAREIDQAAGRGFQEIAFTGGEPTIRGDLPALIKFAKRRGFKQIKVSSNGLRYADINYLDYLIECGVNQFHISMHAFSDRDYELVVQRAETAKLRKQAISHLILRNTDPAADLILKEDTYRHIQAWIESLADQGIRRFALWLVSLTDNNALNTGQLPRISEIVPYLMAAFDWSKSKGLEVISLHIPRCFMPGYEHHVKHPGAGITRVVTPDEVFDLKQSRLTGGVKPGGCEGCRFFNECPGLRPDYVQRFGGDEARAVR